MERCFHEAVDDYLEFCAEKGKEPERALRVFNVRTGSELHKQQHWRRQEGESLNKFVSSNRRGVVIETVAKTTTRVSVFPSWLFLVLPR
ncbi:MAG: toxin-antitoxin system HicB family antitoxin [Collinsella sp.]